MSTAKILVIAAVFLAPPMMASAEPSLRRPAAEAGLQNPFTASLESEIAINAPPATVWTILTDFKAYPSWNPFIRRIAGEPVVGGKIEVTVQTSPSARPLEFSPVVVTFESGREFTWRGSLLFPGVFDGIHSFKLIPLPDGSTRLLHNERFVGALTPVFRGQMMRDTDIAFAKMNAALKARAEAAASGAGRP